MLLKFKEKGTLKTSKFRFHKFVKIGSWQHKIALLTKFQKFFSLILFLKEEDMPRI